MANDNCFTEVREGEGMFLHTLGMKEPCPSWSWVISRWCPSRWHSQQEIRARGICKEGHLQCHTTIPGIIQTTICWQKAGQSGVLYNLMLYSRQSECITQIFLTKCFLKIIQKTLHQNSLSKNFFFFWEWTSIATEMM